MKALPPSHAADDVLACHVPDNPLSCPLKGSARRHHEDDVGVGVDVSVGSGVPDGVDVTGGVPPAVGVKLGLRVRDGVDCGDRVAVPVAMGVTLLVPLRVAPVEIEDDGVTEADIVGVTVLVGVPLGGT